ncbi:MAG: TlpA disulfide reductase family protein [Ferruginibacter sp.]
MKKCLLIFIIIIACTSCDQRQQKGRFKISGEMKNVPEQKIYLEQLYFSQKEPDLLDTGVLKNGKFEMSAIANEEGLFRVRLEKTQLGFVFINDQPDIRIYADSSIASWDAITYNTPANNKLKNFLKECTARFTKYQEVSSRTANGSTVNDNLAIEDNRKLKELDESFKSFIIRTINSTTDPVLAMFAFGYTRNADQKQILDIVSGLKKKFPRHEGVRSLITEYERSIKQQSQREAQTSTLPIGSMAPDFTMNDIKGKPFSLSQLKGKYVLIDFWASWCGPCRSENPNLVAAYNRYKDKNFTILGVSLDEDKDAWLKAIKADDLSWNHISDLKGWMSEASALYGFDGIPYNVLIDPEGKIIASSLRGSDLDIKLSEVLK